MSSDPLPVVTLPERGGAAPSRGAMPTVACPACQPPAVSQGTAASERAQRETLLRLGLGIFCSLNVMAFTMALWSQDVYGATPDASEFAVVLRSLFRYLTLLFSLPVLFLLGGPILSGVLRALKQRTITTDLLILLGVVAAFIYSTVTVVTDEGHIYFEVSCMVLVFVTLGRWLEARGKQQTAASLDALSELLPKTVRLVRDDGTIEVPREQAVRGDTIRVLAGERFALDGRIVRGSAEIDEQLVTGESVAVSKRVGDAVYSGTLNADGDLWIEVTAIAGQETVSRMLSLVRQARESKGKHARLADRVATWFVPSVCLIAVLTAIWHGRVSGFDDGMLAGLAVVLIACPCALGLATPMAIWTALGRAARSQVLFRSGETLEELAEIRVARFDKTGTLTSGRTTVAEFVADPSSDHHQVLRVAQGLAAGSTHSFSEAITAYAGNETAPLPMDALTTTPGKGVSAKIQDQEYVAHLGSPRWMRESGLAVDPALQIRIDAAGAADAPLACVGWDGRVRGVFVYRERIRPEASAALADCRQLGLDAAVLTGDHRQRADRIAAELQVPVSAELLPQDKIAAVTSAQSAFGKVAMVGDGINDAPAMAAADVGVAMGCGADLSRATAGVCLLGDNLDRFGWSVALARRTVRIIRQNLFWAFVYNVGGIGLATAGRLNPIWAALAMAFSSFFVVTNSLRLSRFAEDIS